jgi:molecular chaperone HtpG
MKPPSKANPEPSEPEAIEVGSFFLETLTTGMYEDPFHCIREYVQNGFDGIQDAIRAGILKEDDGRILISIAGTPRAPSLTIRDNGIGIAAAQAYSTLVSLGASRKTPAQHAGFRGIGRLAGIAYCTTLRFTTTLRGEPTATIVEFDCGRVRGYFSPGAEPVDVRIVVRSSVKTRTIPENESEHYTQVEMLRLVNLGLEFVQTPKLQPYLRQVCPVEYQDTFDFSDRIQSLAKSFGERLSTVHVEMRQKRERVAILKPYKNSYPTARRNVASTIHNVEVFTSKEHGWFGWIGISNFPGEIVDEMAAGLRFRMKNIQIGNSEIIEGIAEELTAAGTERRLQPWAVGEIFITNSQVVPNARRDGFEDGAAWRAIRKDIKERVVKRIVKLVRGASGTRSAMKLLAEALKRATAQLEQPSITSPLKVKLEAEIKRHLQTLSSPDKLLGADPKEVSALSSKFKELLETLEKLPVEDPPPETETTSDDPNKDETSGTPDEDADGEPADEDDDPDEPTGPDAVDLIYQVLSAELGEEQARRLAYLIAACLRDAGLIVD